VGLALGHQLGRHRHRGVLLARQRLARLLVHAHEVRGVLHGDALGAVLGVRQRRVNHLTVPHQQRVDVGRLQRELSGPAHHLLGAVVAPHHIEGNRDVLDVL
jgi:hypothetical protein